MFLLGGEHIILTGIDLVEIHSSLRSLHNLGFETLGLVLFRDPLGFLYALRPTHEPHLSGSSYRAFHQCDNLVKVYLSYHYHKNIIFLPYKQSLYILSKKHYIWPSDLPEKAEG